MGGTKTKTYVNMSVTPLMDDPEDYYKALRNNTYKGLKQGLKEVSKRHGEAIVDTKSMMHPTYLKNLGFDPDETLRVNLLDPDDVLLWTQSNVDAGASNIGNLREGYATYKDVAVRWFHENYEYNATTDALSYLGKEWEFVSAVGNGEYVSVSVRLDTDTTVEEYLGEHPEYEDAGEIYVENDTNITVLVIEGSEQFEVTVPYVYQVFEIEDSRHAELVNLVDSTPSEVYYDSGSIKEGSVDDGYTTRVVWHVSARITLVINDNMEIGATARVISQSAQNVGNVDYSPNVSRAVESMKQQAITKFNENLTENSVHLLWEFTVDGKVYKWYENKVSMGDVETEQNLEAFPIIPIKENGSFSEVTSSTTAIANKIGMDVTDFQEELTNSQINSAFVSFMVPITAESDVEVKYLFDLLDAFVVGDVSIGSDKYQFYTKGYQSSISFNKLSMTTKVIYDREYVPGSIGDVGTYTSTLDTITNTTTSTNSDGESTTTTIVDDIRHLRKQVTEDYYVELTITSIETTGAAYGYSTAETGVTNPACLLPLSRTLILENSLEDYSYILASSLHVIVLAVQIVKIKWYQHGFGKFLLIVVGAVIAYYTGGWGGLAVYSLLTIAIESGLLYGDALRIVQIAMIVYGGYQVLTTKMSATMLTLAVANTLVQVASMANQINAESAIAKAQSRYNETVSRAEESQEQLEELLSTLQQGIWIGIDDKDPELFYRMACDTDVMCNNDILYDVDGLIERGMPT